MKLTNFNPVWKKDALFQAWLLPDPMNKHNFRCKFCQSSLELANMGRAAVVKHMKSSKHVTNSQELNSTSAGLLASWTRPVNKNVESSNVTTGISVNSASGSTSESIAVQYNETGSAPSTSKALET